MIKLIYKIKQHRKQHIIYLINCLLDSYKIINNEHVDYMRDGKILTVNEQLKCVILDLHFENYVHTRFNINKIQLRNDVKNSQEIKNIIGDIIKVR